MRKEGSFVKKAGALILAAALVLGLFPTSLQGRTVKAAGAVNVAKGIIPTVAWLDGSTMTEGPDGETDYNSVVRATDGVYAPADVFFRYGQTMPNGSTAKPSYAQFDLGKRYDISSIKMWRYWADSRNYAPTAIVVSDSSNAKWTAENATVIYSSDKDNIYGFGAGTDEGYAETAAGKEFPCSVTGRYVRIYSNGSNVNSGNHLVEFEVYGEEHRKLENLALKKEVVLRKTADDSPASNDPNRPAAMAVDGIIPASSDSNYADYGDWYTEFSSYLQIDLKGNYELTGINLWRYWQDGRTYRGTVIAAAYAEEDFKDGRSTILYNSDAENYHGLGEGTDSTYAETANGIKISLADRFPDQTIEARYVRIYMHGNNTGNSNHVVECQVIGYNDGQKPYVAKAFDNTGNYVDLPTHYDRYYPADPNAAPGKHLPGQVTHPDVVKVEEGLGGHQYWMFYTPNVMVTSQFENPYIAYSDDGIHWEEPVGDDGETVNPVAARVTGPTETDSHNCDTDLVYDSKNKRLMAYWNWSSDVGNADCQVRMMVSYDGIHWGAPVEGKEADKEIREGEYVIAVRDTVTKYNLLSPTITYDSHKELYFMYYNNSGNVGYFNGQNNKVQVRYSKDGINWSEDVRDVVNFLGKDQNGQQLAPWHQDVQYIPEKNEYWALSQCFAGSSPDGSVLYMTRSKDGLNWEQVGNQPVLIPNDAPFWNDFQIYRSTFVYNADTDTMDIWYSALQTTPPDRKVADAEGKLTLTAGTDDSRVWRIGHTSNEMSEVLKALTQDEFYEETEAIASRGFMLTANKSVLRSGETTDTITKWSVHGGWGGGGDAAPDNTVSDMNIRFTSDNEAVATVDPWGKITAHGDGKAIISGITQEGSETEILITVGAQIKEKPRQTIDRDHPLYIANYYWSDGAPVESIDDCDAGRYPERNYISDELNEDGTRVDRDDPLKLWNTIPDDLKDNTVVLLIAERSIKDNVIEEGTADVNAIRAWYKKQVEFCNKNKIPCAVQNLNGETSTYDRIPLSFWKELAEENEYLVGFNGAELYNRFNGGAANNADEYVADLIRMGAALGVTMMWTDTNVFGSHGVLMDWLEEDNSVLGNAMLDNHEYVSMMYKESYGNPSTDALYLGLWLTGYCDNWGVASDWWHWSIDGNGTMFDKSGSIGSWGSCLVWPDNMYSQDVIRVASMGATSYKHEPQWFSVASNGHRTPSYQYSIMPTLQKICGGEIYIPTKEEVAARIKLVVKGTENFRSVIYDTSYSQLYPKTGQYGIVPLVPNTVSNERLKELGFTNIVETPLTEAMLKEVYSETKYQGNAWAEHFGKTWYMMNSSEDKDVTQSATVTMTPAELTVAMTPHTYAVATEKSDSRIDLILSNYRLDKSELWSGNQAESMSKVYQYIWEISERMENNEGLDTQLRETVLTIKSEKKPIITFKNEGDNTYAYDNYTRPFKYSEITGEANNWTITIKHNGFVECTILTDDQEKPVDPVEPEQKADKSVLEALLNSVKSLDMNLYTAESAAVFQVAFARASAVMADATLSEDDQKVVDQAVKALADARDALKLKDADPAGDNKPADDDNKPTGDNKPAGDGSETGNGNQSTAPKTGDDSMAVLWTSLLAIIALGGAIMLCLRRRRIR